MKRFHVSVAVADWVTPDKNGNLTGHAETIYTVQVGELEWVELKGDAEVEPDRLNQQAGTTFPSRSLRLAPSWPYCHR